MDLEDKQACSSSFSPSFFSLWSPLPLPPPSPSLFPSSLSWEQGVQAVQTPPAAPLIVTASNNGPVERSSGATLSAEGRLPQHSKAAEVYWRSKEQTTTFANHLRTAESQGRGETPETSLHAPGRVDYHEFRFKVQTWTWLAQALCVCPSLLKASGALRQCHQFDRGMVA